MNITENSTRVAKDTITTDDVIKDGSGAFMRVDRREVGAYFVKFYGRRLADNSPTYRNVRATATTINRYSEAR